MKYKWNYRNNFSCPQVGENLLPAVRGTLKYRDIACVYHKNAGDFIFFEENHFPRAVCVQHASLRDVPEVFFGKC